MLRAVAIVLVLANAAYAAWTGGYLAAVGLAPQVQAEPQRLHEQVNPGLVRLLNSPRPAPATASATAPAHTVAAPEVPPVAAAPAAAGAPEASPTVAPAPAPLATACWHAGGYSEAQASQLRSALDGLPGLRGQWRIDEARLGGRWVVYMGKLSTEMMQRKKSELRTMKVDFREVRAPHLSPGLALGTYSSEAAAQQGLQEVARKGVRTARVSQEREESISHTLTLPAVTAAQREQVQALLGGKALTVCE